MTVRDMMKILRKDGWYVVGQEGSHIQMEHSNKPGKVTLPNHKGDIRKGTKDSILKQAGLK